MVFALDGIPTDSQRLIFGGRQLVDWGAVADFDVRNGSVLYLVIRLRGGARTRQTARRSERLEEVTVVATPATGILEWDGSKKSNSGPL